MLREDEPDGDQKLLNLREGSTELVHRGSDGGTTSSSLETPLLANANVTDICTVSTLLRIQVHLTGLWSAEPAQL